MTEYSFRSINKLNSGVIQDYNHDLSIILYQSYLLLHLFIFYHYIHWLIDHCKLYWDEREPIFNQS